MSAVAYGVHSEVGTLRKVLVCAPGRAHERLTPTNCDALLFDDVLWVEAARRDHAEFVARLGERGVEVVELHREDKPFVEVVAAALGLKRLRVVETGGSAYERERTRWDSGANLVCASPGVVFAYDRNTHTNALLREAGVEVIPIAGVAAATA